VRSTTVKPYLVAFLVSFCLGFIVLFPTQPQLLPNIQLAINSWLAPLITWIGENLLGFSTFNPVILSDSKAMYCMVVLLFFTSCFFAFISPWIKKPLPNAYYWFIVILRYYLAYQLLHYGFNKVFKWQFFLPEPNIVYTELGQLQPDLLYWSAVGSSYGYTVFLGLVEVSAALLLLFKKTYRFGSLLSVIVMANVVSINFGFNISVKLFSSFLFLLSVTISWPALTRIYELLQGKKYKTLVNDEQRARGWLYYLTKTLLVLFLLADVLYLYATSGNWNDDVVERPPLHGAYEVIQSNQPLTQLYVHRKGYFITRDTADTYTDYQLFFDKTEQRIQVEHLDDVVIYEYEWLNENVLRLISMNDSLVARKLPYRELPLFKRNFDWWVD